MRVVSENSEYDLKRKRHQELVASCLRELTANLLRVTRGAGKPYEIPMQAQSFIDAVVSYRDAVEHMPFPEDFAEALNVDVPHEIMVQLNEDSRDSTYAEDLIIAGVLQTVASRLLHQRTQERAGDSEMYKGIRELNEVRERQRRKPVMSYSELKAAKPTKKSKKSGRVEDL